MSSFTHTHTFTHTLAHKQTLRKASSCRPVLVKSYFLHMTLEALTYLQDAVLLLCSLFKPSADTYHILTHKTTRTLEMLVLSTIKDIFKHFHHKVWLYNEVVKS